MINLNSKNAFDNTSSGVVTGACVNVCGLTIGNLYIVEKGYHQFFSLLVILMEKEKSFF